VRRARSLRGWAASAWMLAVLGSATSGCVHTSTPPPPPGAVPATKPGHELGEETGTPVASTPQGLMHDGAENRIQERLRARGLLGAEHRTGRFDLATREALRKFQKREGLPATGLPSYETIEHMGLKLDSIYRAREHTADKAPTRTASPR
jgi:peptidoglycan hydrolase-like protein with peptidoglycan-binding domain